MADVIAIIMGRCLYPFFYCGTCCVTTLFSVVHLKSLEGVLTLTVWQMLLPMWKMESHYVEWQMYITYCA